MSTQDKVQGLTENEREILAMLAEPPVSQHELFALCLAAKKIIDRLSFTGDAALIDPKEIADEIMDTLIDERNLTANDLLNGDQAAFLHVAIISRLSAVSPPPRNSGRGLQTAEPCKRSTESIIALFVESA